MAFHWSVTGLPGVILLEKTVSPPPQLEVRLHVLSLCDGIWSNLSLHRPCACCHRCSESICAGGLLSLEDAVSLWSSTPCGSYTLSVPSSAMIPESWEEGVKNFFFVLFLFLFFEAEPHLAEAGFEPLTFLPPPLKCWDYRHVSPTSSLKFCLLSLLIASSQGAWSIHSCCNSHSDRPHEAHSVGSGCHWFPLHPVLQSLLLAQADLNETNSEFNEAILILPDQLEVRTEVQEPRPAGSPDHKTCWTNYCRWMFQEAEEQNPVYVILSLRGLCVQNILQWENSNEKAASHWVCPRPPGELSRTLCSPKKNRF